MSSLDDSGAKKVEAMIEEASADQRDAIEAQVTTALIRIGKHIIVAAWTTVALLVIGAFGIGSWFSETNVQMTVANTRLSHIESLLGQGVLPRADERLQALERRVESIERPQ